MDNAMCGYLVSEVLVLLAALHNMWAFAYM